jgi:hypothetical protein
MSYQHHDLTAAERRLLLDLASNDDRLTVTDPGVDLRAAIDTLVEARYADAHPVAEHLIVDLRDEAWRWARTELDAGTYPAAAADDIEAAAWRWLQRRIAAASAVVHTDNEWGHVSMETRVDMRTVDEPGRVDPAEAHVSAGRGSWDHNDGIELTVIVRRDDPADSVFAYCEVDPTEARKLAAALNAGADLIDDHPRPVSQHVEYAWHDLRYTDGVELTRTTVLAHDRLRGIDAAAAAAALDLLLDKGELPLPDGTTAEAFAA